MRVVILAALSTAIAFGNPFTQIQPEACLDGTAAGHCSTALSGSFTFGNDHMTYNDSAASFFGIMHVSTSSSFTVSNNQAFSYGFVAFQDDITVNSLTKQGQPGTLTLGYTVDGTISQSGQSTAFLQVVMRVFAPSLQNWVDDFPTTTPITGTHVSRAFNIVYGTPFTLYFSMQATNGTVSDLGLMGYNIVTRNGSGSGSADFFNTFRLDGLATDDPNASFASSSMTTYTQQGVVPEPSTFLLGGLGVIAIALSRVRKTKRAGK